jgi:capsular polysaccharide export protein
MKILFCCHYAEIHDYFLGISRHIADHETELIDLKAIENSHRQVKYDGRIPWRELWQIAHLIEQGRCIRRGALYMRRYWRWLPISAFLQGLQQYKANYAVLKEKSADAVCIWGAKYRTSLLALAARKQQLAIIHLEHGVLPFTVAVDLEGINADNSLPRDAAFYRSLPTAPALAATPSLEVRQAYPDKHGEDAGLSALPERYIFAPFQVDTDTQILLQSPWIKDMRRFFRILVRVFKQLDDPQLHLIFKEHPSSESEYPDLHRAASNEARIHIVNNRLTQDLIENAECVVTINSGVGIESLLFDRPVIVAGRAFYNIPDLVLQAESETGLQHALRSIRSFRTDQLLRRNFLHYLETEYLVPGKKFSKDEPHLQAMASRISLLLENQSA